jgi:hypothetical protein
VLLPLAGVFKPLPVGIMLLDPATAVATLPAVAVPGAGTTGLTVALGELSDSSGEHPTPASTKANTATANAFFIGLPQLLAVGT